MNMFVHYLLCTLTELLRWLMRDLVWTYPGTPACGHWRTSEYHIHESPFFCASQNWCSSNVHWRWCFTWSQERYVARFDYPSLNTKLNVKWKKLSLFFVVNAGLRHWHMPYVLSKFVILNEPELIIWIIMLLGIISLDQC